MVSYAPLPILEVEESLMIIVEAVILGILAVGGRVTEQEVSEG